MKTRNTLNKLCMLALVAALAALPLDAAQGKDKGQEQDNAPAQGKAQAEESARGKGAPSPSATYHNRYEIRFLDLHSAEQLAWDLCSDRERCRVTAQSVDEKSGGILAVEADTATHEKIVRELAKRDAAPKTQMFQVVLLSGSTKAGSSPKDLSAGAQKALNDLKGFLPYKSYELLDSTLIPGTAESLATGRLVGVAYQAYEVRLGFRSSGAGPQGDLFVSRFSLREDPGTTPVVTGVSSGPGIPLRRAPRQLVDTTFSLKPGETIVVGTSRLDGMEEALVTLLTALP